MAEMIADNPQTKETVVMDGTPVDVIAPPQMSLGLDPTEKLPAPAAEAAVMSPPEPASRVTTAPPPPQTPAIKARKTRDDVDRLVDELEATKASLDRAREEHLEQAQKMRGEMVARKNDERIATLRQMGAKTDLTDEQLLMLAPDADIKTPAGRARVDEWKAANPKLFNAVEGSIHEDPHKFLATVGSTPFGTFGPQTAQAMIDHIFADGKK